MTADHALMLVLAAVALGQAYVIWTIRGSAAPPADPLERRISGIFDAFENNTTLVVGGLQEDIQGLRQEIERLSRWAPGAAPENPAQLARFMAESSADRRQLRRAVNLLIGLVSALAVVQAVEIIGHARGWW